MKKISIFREKGTPVQLFDNDTTALSEYARKLTSAMKATNVVILETSESSLLIRPHKVDGIEVSDVESLQEEIDQEESDNNGIEGDTKTIITALEEEDKEEHVDIITDGD